ncbi:MAG: proprotein convertase P-domain-containing protein, partial [Flavobacteriales bacterium]|nr:proprotein convertase P-domain-containing protein [Flavobacteriales bacterium]
TEQNPSITSATTAANGTYTLTVTNGACASNGTTAVLVDTAPVVNSFTVDPTPACENGTADMVIDVGPFTSSYSGNASSGSNLGLAINNTLPPVSTTLAVSGTGVTIDAGTVVSVGLNITHTFDADLDMFLIGPASCGTLELATDVGGGGDNFTGTTLTTGPAANGPVTGGTAPFTGVYGTEGTIASLAGCPVDGTWTLQITDDAGGDVGTLDDWSVTISGGITVTGNYSTVFSGPTTIDPPVYSGPNDHIATGTVNAILAGTNSYTAVVSGPNGCPTTANVDVIGNPQLQAGDPTIAPLAPFFCGTGSVTLTATPNGGGAPYTYAWTDPNSDPAGTDPSVDASIGGVWTVDIIDGCGGTGQATVTVVAQPEPTASIGFSSVCIGEALVLNATSDGATFSWSGPNGFTSTELAPQVTASATAAEEGTYVLDVDLNGCTNQASIDVQVGTTFPTVAFSAVDNPACEGASTDLVAVAGPLVESFNATNSSGAISVPIPDSNTNGVFSDLALSGTGATVDASTSVSVDLNITHTWNSDLDIFLVGPGACGTLELSTDNGGTTANGYTGTTLTLGASPNIVGATPPFSGVYGTEGLDLITAPANGGSPIPAAALSGCPVDGTWRLFIRDDAGGDTGNLTSWGISLSGSAPLVGNYSTVFSGGTVGAPSYSGTNNETATATESSVPSGSTIYTAVVTSPNGCSTTETLTLVGNPQLALNDPTISPAAPILCGTGTVTLTANPNGGGAPYTYAWTDPSSAPAGTDPTVDANVAGLWTVTINDNCGGTGVATVTVTAEPQPTVSANATPGCVGQDLTLTGTTDIGTIFSWSGPNSFASTDLNPADIVGVTAANAGTYTLTVESAAGCTNTATVAVDVFDPPVISSVTAVPTTLCAGGNSQLNVVDNASGYSLQSIAFAPVTGTGTNGPGSDDSQVSAPIGFSFPFYGTNYTSVNIVSNGFLSFLPASSFSYGQAIPNAAAPNAVIALAWEDLNPSAGQITYFNLTSPNRFVVNFNAVNFYFSTPGVTAQVILYEDGTIEMHNTSITATGGNTATQGIENETGTLATVVPGRNDALFTATNEAWRFAPINVTWSWSPTTYLNDATIPNPNAEGMLTSETYTVTVTGAGGCTAEGTVAVTVNPLPVVDAGTYPTQCGLDASTDVPLVGSPAGGTFTGTGVSGTVGSQVFDPSVGTQTLTYTYFDGTCLNSDQVTITVEETDGDLDGIPDFCDECPLVYGQIGDFCNAGTGFDVVPGTLDASCNCVATPCTENIVVELLTPDGSSEQASFEIYYEGTPTLACRGGVPAFPTGITTPIVTGCCLPQGCFKLYVYDSAGDGFASGGGYEVREQGANGRRIIDNNGNFSSGSESTINNSQSFCLPIGDIDLINHGCDKLDWVNYQYLVCHADANVTAEWQVGNQNNDGYNFWIFDPNGSYSFRRFRTHATSDGFSPASATRAAHLRINGWSDTPLTPHIPANQLMNVRVRGVYNWNFTPWGPTCTMMIDPARAACPLVWLQDDATNTDD